MHRSAAAVLVLLSTAFAQERGRHRAVQQPAMTLPPLNQKDTEDVVAAFGRADTWSQQAIALFSLGTDWHPAGSAIVLAALQARDARLHCFGVEQLRRTDARVFASVCTQPVVAELVEHQLQAKWELLRNRTLEVLERLFPNAGHDAPAMVAYWREHQKDYQPPAWTPPASDPNANKTVAMPMMERAFDLRDAGLQIAIVIDSTSSMQAGIDAARDAINDVTAILASIAPKLELGLVHYKDVTDFKPGARILEPMTRDQQKVREHLAHLTAEGGGDPPEKVDAGVELALSKEMNWNRNANRLILIVGDAPPHQEDMAGLLAMVERAHLHPFQTGKQPVTGTDGQQLRPFITSAIAISPEAKGAFDQIAKAGGGTCVLMSMRRGGRGSLLPGNVGKKTANDADAAEQVARHVLTLSFGAQFEPQLRAFVDTFFAYHKAGAL
jgi:hypothetical protein